MFRRLQIVGLALAGLVAIAQPALAQRFIRRAPVFVTPYYGYGYAYGPAWYGPYYPSYYPYWGGAYLVPHYNSGEVKIVTKMKDEPIYVDGGYAGVTGKLKHFNLSPGNHEIELRDPSGRTIFQQRVQVILGRTTEIHPAP
jgi:hypothetical protein